MVGGSGLAKVIDADDFNTDDNGYIEFTKGDEVVAVLNPGDNCIVEKVTS